VKFRDRLLLIGNDRKGCGTAGDHHHPRIVRRPQQGKERMRDPNWSEHVGGVDGLNFNLLISQVFCTTCTRSARHPAGTRHVMLAGLLFSLQGARRLALR
jgi:hypothetical protein